MGRISASQELMNLHRDADNFRNQKKKIKMVRTRGNNARKNNCEGV
jgi:hypothetical protein